MKQFNMEVSKKVNGAYELVGTVVVNYPLLSELGYNVEPKEYDADNLPVYVDDISQYVFDSVFASVKANARNKLVSGSTALKDGLKIAETVAELIAVGERNGAALQNLRDLLAKFKAWLPATGKATATQTALYDLVSNRKALALASDTVKGKVSSYLADFAESLSEADLELYARILQTLDDATQSVDALDDL